MAWMWKIRNIVFVIRIALIGLGRALGGSLRLSFFACRVIGHRQGSDGLFFVFCWATPKRSWGFLFFFGAKGLKPLEFFLSLQFSALISGFVLEIVDLWGDFFSGGLKFTSSLRCLGLTGGLLTRVDVDVLRPAQSQPVAAGATLGTPSCREKMPSLFVLSLSHFRFEWVLIIEL